MTMDVNSPEAAQWSDLMRRNSELEHEVDRLLTLLDPPVCRLQFPDGGVPGNAAEAAVGWHRLYGEKQTEIANLESEIEYYRSLLKHLLANPLGVVATEARAALANRNIK